MHDSEGMLISLPAGEFAGIELPGSLFDAEVLASAPLSRQVRAAIDLLLAAGAGHSRPPRFVARPEMFPEGESLAWLHANAEGATDHISISSGKVVKSVGGMRNHLFLVRVDQQQCESDLTTLARRAPQIFSTFDSQINTAFAIRKRRGTLCVPTTAISGFDRPEPGAATLTRLFLNRHSTEDSVDRTLMGEAVPIAQLHGFARGTYVMLSETMLLDPHFRDALAQLTLRCYFDPRVCLVLRLPPLETGHSDGKAMLRRLVEALRAGRSKLPGIPAANVFLSTEDVDGPGLDAIGIPMRLITCDSAPLWLHAPEYYRRFADVGIVLRRGRARVRQFAHMAEHLLGRSYTSYPLREDLAL